jgi:2-keto-4-pentenoate hydratase/2-oxohepta-3-ene-1,7-dioic acid hydratase in catechol pathway/pimeloyl-ACP methyl ester carboxylesterase
MAPNGVSHAHTNGVYETTNYVAYRDAKGQPRIGHLNMEDSTIVPLAFVSGAPVMDLYQVIEVGDSKINPSGKTFPLSSVELLPTISGRDILCVGKNYSEHAKEFNSSGYDSSDKVDQPTHPVIFTKRSTSIIASGEPIFPHPGFTESLDYEGEIGVIVGETGFRIDEADAMDYVWGYTIINDMTARERQRDHKQFYIGKSPDTFCPIGPIAVPAHKLDKTLRVQTHVNGECRQDSTTEDLIFSIPFLIKTLSEGQTLQPGDVLATGTPAGVGIGKKPPVFLKPGDVIEVSVTGLGTLTNTIAEPTSENYTVSRVAAETHMITSGLEKTCGGSGLTNINSKNLYYRRLGFASGPPVIFIHGLGGSSEFYAPVITALGLLETHSLHLLDLEGHGLSPTAATSVISISSYADDFYALAQQAGIGKATVIAHSMGCLVALTLAAKHAELVEKLVLLGPPPSPVPEAGRSASVARAATVRGSGMAAVVDAVVTAGTSAHSKSDNLLAVAAVRLSLLSQDPEGYAKGCTALAGADSAIGVSQIKATTLIVTGDEDKISPPQACEAYAQAIKGTKVEVLKHVGHWHAFEDVEGVAAVVRPFLQR